MKTISSLFTFFFLQKRFRAYKNVCKQTLANKTKNKSAKNNKDSGFLHAQASKRGKSLDLRFVFFVRVKSFCKKKKINKQT